MSIEKAKKILKKEIGWMEAVNWTGRVIYRSLNDALAELKAESKNPTEYPHQIHLACKTAEEFRQKLQLLVPYDLFGEDESKPEPTELRDQLDDAAWNFDKSKWKIWAERALKTIESQAEQLKEIRSQHPPCSRTCYHHQTHPCENCGRINGYSPLVWRAEQLAAANKEIERLRNYVRHKQHCERVLAQRFGGDITTPCNCGFDQALKGGK